MCCEARTTLSAPALGFLLGLKPCRPRLLQLSLYTLLKPGPRCFQLVLPLLGTTLLFQLELHVFGTSDGFELRCQPRLLQLSPRFPQLGLCLSSEIVGFELLRRRPCLLQLSPRPLQLGLRAFQVRYLAVIGHVPKHRWRGVWGWRPGELFC